MTGTGKVKIDAVGGELVATGDTYPWKEQLRRAGFLWDPRRKCWFTRRPELLRMKYVESVWLSQAARELLERLQDRAEKSRAATAEADLPVPPGRALLPFQAAGVSYALATLREGRGVLLADEMGLGKTVQTIVVANVLQPRTVLVVCPASLKRNWQREWERWSTLGLSVGIAEGSNWPETAVVIVNYDILSRFPDQLGRQWDLLILDEAHKVKNPKAARTQAALSIQARWRLYLTGTPLLNRPVELWPLIHSLDPERFSNFFGFAKRYCAAKQVPAGRKMVWDFSGASNLSELQHVLRSRVMVRRRKSEVLRELPPKWRQIIELDPNGAAGALEAEREAWERFTCWYSEQRAKCDLIAAEDTEAWRRAVAELQQGARAFFSELAHLRHTTALAKVPAVVAHVEELLESADKVVVFAHHLDVIGAIADGLRKYGVVTLTGDTPAAARQEAVDAFQSDPKVRVFVGSITAAGLGLTLTAAHVVVFAELDWVPANVTQAEDRCHRIGQQDSVLVQHLVLAGSIDAHVARVIVDKQDVADRALDRSADLSEPVLPVDVPPPPRRQDLDAVAARLTPEAVRAIHEGLQLLAGLDPDRARARNELGFDKYDSALGHRLASLQSLSPRQAALGAALLRKYRRQLPDDVVRHVEAVLGT